MPNAISPGKRSITFLENRKVLEWMEKTARARETDLAVILREATSAYYARHNNPADSTSLFAQRAAAKAAHRALTARQIADGKLTPEEAQASNAPIRQPVQVVDLWSAIRRRDRSNA